MPELDARNYLDPQTLASIGSIELRARMIVEGLMTGMHRSPMQGFSVEFAQHRQYAPGDDTRFLDWKVYGKTDKLYLKQYQKETNLDMMVLVDVSGSMSYASNTTTKWRKYDHAASLAAAMSHLALKQQDRVGLMLFDHRVQRATRMSNASDHWRTIAEVLQTAEINQQIETSPPPSSPTSSAEQERSDLTRMFDQVVAKLARRSLVVIISDLFDEPHILERGLARLHHRRHDVIVLQVMDPAELAFPFRSPTEFLGLEGEGHLPLDPAALRDVYLSIVEQHLREIQRVARSFRFDHVLLDSSKPLGPTLSHFLARRAARSSGG